MSERVKKNPNAIENKRMSSLTNGGESDSGTIVNNGKRSPLSGNGQLPHVVNSTKQSPRRVPIVGAQHGKMMINILN